jgi:signal transduction histidine kinase
VTGRVRATGAPARIDSYDNAESELGIIVRERGVRSSVGAPIVIDNEVWGVLTAGTDLPTPAGPHAEEQMTRVAGLVATAVSNAAARSALIASRARILTAGDQARRRFERDLHDGVQQRLVVLGLRLQALNDLILPEATQAHEELEGLRREADAVFDHIRQISRGLHPAALSHGGLRPALGVLARTSPIPVELSVEGDDSLPETVRICVYYVVSELLTNAAKHSGADHVSVTVNRTGDTLHVRIDDDGRGGAHPATGSGLIGLIDRVDAVGGRLTLDSTVGQGTHVAVNLPIEHRR